MDFEIIPDKEALSRCAWCQSQITDTMEVFAFGAKLKPDIDVSEYESHCIEVGLVSMEKSVYMMVTARGSEARNEGKDCMFLVCSDGCAKKMKNVLEKEVSLGELFKKVQYE
jgi:hypothetical protein